LTNSLTQMTQPKLNSRRWLALILLCAAQFMMVLDFSIVNVALPAMQIDLGFSQQNLQWVVSAYSLAFGGFLLLGGRAADLFGRRRVFMAGLGLFTLASLIGGLAQLQGMLIVARAVQGLGAAIVSPAALSILTTTFTEGQERNRALSVWGAIVAGGFAAGVLLGGILTDALSWRSVMFVNVPIGLLTLVLAPMLLPESRERAATQKIDLLGAVTVTSGLVALVYALEQASGASWGSAQTLILFGIALALLAAFVWIEAHAQNPLVPLHVFRLRTLTGANLIGLLMSAAIGSTIFILTLYMQQVLNYSALQTGLAFLPHAIAAMIAAPIASQLATRFGTKTTLTGSMTLAAVGLLHLSRIPVQGNFVRDLLPGTVIIGFGIVMTLVSVTIAATAGISNSEQGMASGLLNTSQQIGAALGLAILVAVSTTRTEAVMAQLGGAADSQRTALTAGFGAALIVSVGFAIAGVLVALFVIQEADCRKTKGGRRAEVGRLP
jgi:EmrB/QacA subfamily drug resistance transporter